MKCLKKLNLAFNNNRTLVLVFITVIFISIITIIILLNPDSKIEIVLGVIGLFMTLVISLNQYWIEYDKMFKELFQDFNIKFNKLNKYLNKIPIELSDNKDDIIQKYLNLCSEEYLWYKKDRIDKEVWDAWKIGMEFYLKNPNIKRVFNDEKKYNVSYYGLFNELKMESN